MSAIITNAVVSSSTPSMVLRNILTHPCKVASIMDWRKPTHPTVLSLTIHKDSIGLAVAAHPSLEEEVTILEPLKLKQGEEQAPTRDYHFVNHHQQLSDIVNENNVCGMIVSWPLEKETGKMGAACGRVVHTLENLLSVQESYQDGDSRITPVLSSSRPICLWDGRHFLEETVDEWGRGAKYCHRPLSMSEEIQVTTCDETGERIATHEYKYRDETMTAARVWNDFCHFYWPELYYENHLIATATHHQSQREQLQSQRELLQQMQMEHHQHCNGSMQQQKDHHAWMTPKSHWDETSAFVNSAIL